MKRCTSLPEDLWYLDYLDRRRRRTLTAPKVNALDAAIAAVLAGAYGLAREIADRADLGRRPREGRLRKSASKCLLRVDSCRGRYTVVDRTSRAILLRDATLDAAEEFVENYL